MSDHCSITELSFSLDLSVHLIAETAWSFLGKLGPSDLPHHFSEARHL